MRLEIEVNVPDDDADKGELQEHLRREAILAPFRGSQDHRRQAARELDQEPIPFMDLLKRRGIP